MNVRFRLAYVVNTAVVGIVVSLFDIVLRWEKERNAPTYRIDVHHFGSLGKRVTGFVQQQIEGEIEAALRDVS